MEIGEHWLEEGGKGKESSGSLEKPGESREKMCGWVALHVRPAAGAYEREGHQDRRLSDAGEGRGAVRGAHRGVGDSRRICHSIGSQSVAEVTTLSESAVTVGRRGHVTVGVGSASQTGTALQSG